jgi:hypothetical protein
MHQSFIEKEDDNKWKCKIGDAMEIEEAIKKQEVEIIEDILHQTGEFIDPLVRAVQSLKNEKSPQTFYVVMNHVMKKLKEFHIDGLGNQYSVFCKTASFQTLDKEYSQLLEELVKNEALEYIQILASPEFQFPEVTTEMDFILGERHLIPRNMADKILKSSAEKGDEKLFNTIIPIDNFNNASMIEAFYTACKHGNEAIVNDCIRWDLRHTNSLKNLQSKSFLIGDQSVLTDEILKQGLNHCILEEHFELALKMMKMKSSFRHPDHLNRALVEGARCQKVDVVDFVMSLKIDLDQNSIARSMECTIQYENINMIQTLLEYDSSEKIHLIISKSLKEKANDNRQNYLKNVLMLNIPFRKEDLNQALYIGIMKNNKEVIDILLTDKDKRAEKKFVDWMIDRHEHEGYHPRILKALLTHQIKALVREHPSAKLVQEEIRILEKTIDKADHPNALFYHSCQKNTSAGIPIHKVLESVLNDHGSRVLSKKDVQSNVKFLRWIREKKSDLQLPENILHHIMKMEVDSPKAILVRLKNKLIRHSVHMNPSISLGKRGMNRDNDPIVLG